MDRQSHIESTMSQSPDKNAIAKTKAAILARREAGSAEAAVAEDRAQTAKKAKEALLRTKETGSASASALRLARQCAPGDLSDDEWRFVASLAVSEGLRADLKMAASRCDISQALPLARAPKETDGFIHHSLLHYAATHEREAIWELAPVLLKAGADPLARDKKGRTILMALAYGSSSPAQLDQLLPVSDVNAQDDKGLTPLMFCVKSIYAGSPENMQSLLAAGANANLIDENGDTALMMAVRGRSFDRVQILAGKTDLSIQNKKGETAASLAIERGKMEILDELCAQMTPEQAAEAGRMTLRALLPKGFPRMEAHRESVRLRDSLDSSLDSPKGEAENEKSAPKSKSSASRSRGGSRL